jgi:hypothetical protein
VTFRRLIKLCYGTTFLKEGDRELDVSELVRLLYVANAFECMDAVKECAIALQGMDLGWEGALQCLELTDVLKGVEGMGGLAKKAAEVLAKEVGPVHELFVPSGEKDKPGVLGGLKLSEKVKVSAAASITYRFYFSKTFCSLRGTVEYQAACPHSHRLEKASEVWVRTPIFTPFPVSQDLSPTVFEALLSSKGLQLKTANEAFWLLLAWVEAQSDESEEGKQELFNRMAKHLYFSAMDPGYILLMVSKHPRIVAAGLESEVLRASLIHANGARRTNDEVDWLTERTPGFSVPKERSPWACGEATWTFDGSYNAANVAAFKTHQLSCKVVGLAAGLPWRIELEHRAAKGGHGVEVGMYAMSRLPFDWMTYGDGSGFFFHSRLEVAPGTAVTKAFTSGKRIFTQASSLGGIVGAWDDVFREGSEWLVDGKLRVRVSVTTINDQGPSKLEARA